MVTWRSLPCSQDPATYVCPEPGNPIHSTNPVCWRSILMASHLRLCLSSGPFPSRFPTITLYAPLLSPIRVTCPTHLHFFWYPSGERKKKVSLSVTNRTCLVLECCQACMEQQYQISDFRPYKNLFLVLGWNTFGLLSCSYCMRFDGKMCNVECTLLKTLVYRHAVTCHSLSSSSSLLMISSTYRMSLLTTKDHNYLARHPFFVLSPVDPVGAVTWQSPAGQTTYTLFQQ